MNVPAPATTMIWLRIRRLGVRIPPGAGIDLWMSRRNMNTARLREGRSDVATKCHRRLRGGPCAEAVRRPWQQ